MHRLRWILIANSEIRLFRRRRKRNSLTKREKEGRRRKKGRDSGFLYVQEREAQREEVARGRKVFDTISEFMSAIHLFEDEDALDDEESLSENSGDRGYWTEMVTKAVGLYTFQVPSAANTSANETGHGSGTTPSKTITSATILPGCGSTTVHSTKVTVPLGVRRTSRRRNLARNAEQKKPKR
jgi:hypothetical protein